MKVYLVWGRDYDSSFVASVFEHEADAIGRAAELERTGSTEELARDAWIAACVDYDDAGEWERHPLYVAWKCTDAALRELGGYSGHGYSVEEREVEPARGGGEGRG